MNGDLLFGKGRGKRGLRTWEIGDVDTAFGAAEEGDAQKESGANELLQRDGILREMAQNLAICGHEHESLFACERDKFAIVGGTAGVGHALHDPGRGDQKFPPGELQFRFGEDLDGCVQTEDILSERAGQSVAKFRAPEERGDPFRVFEPRFVGGLGVGRSQPAVTDDICIYDDHTRPCLIHPLTSRAVTARLKWLRA